MRKVFQRRSARNRRLTAASRLGDILGGAVEFPILNTMMKRSRITRSTDADRRAADVARYRADPGGWKALGASTRNWWASIPRLNRIATVILVTGFLVGMGFLNYSPYKPDQAHARAEAEAHGIARAVHDGVYDRLYHEAAAEIAARNGKPYTDAELKSFENRRYQSLRPTYGPGLISSYPEPWEDPDLPQAE